MNSLQTKNYRLIDSKAIGQVLLMPDKVGFRISVAWEWEEMAKTGFFAIINSKKYCVTNDELFLVLRNMETMLHCLMKPGNYSSLVLIS